MQIVVINLKQSVERLERVERELTKAGLKFDIFEATDASQKNFTYADRANAELTKKRKGYELTPGELACYSSHLRVWERCVEIGECVLVLEDNVELGDTLPDQGIGALLTEIPPHDYVKLAARANTDVKKFKTCSRLTGIYSLVRYARGTCGTTAYLITPEGARKLIAGSAEFLEPVDDYMEKFWRHHVIAYSVTPPIFQRANSESVIGIGRKKRARLNIPNKIYTEAFRGYERVMYWICFFRY